MSRALPLLRLAPLALALAGCSMADSTLMEPGRDMACTKDGGTYYLSRTMLRVVVQENAALADRLETGRYALEKIEARVKQDPRYAFCLDFLRSPTSDDTLIVTRNESLLLQRVSSIADDKSVEIARTIIRTIFAGLTQDPKFGERADVPGQLGTTKRYDIEYDPFDEDQAALVNDELRRYGFCIVVETKEFLARQRKIDAYCDRPLGSGRREAALAAAGSARAAPPIRHAEGVFYRPRLPHNVFVFVKRNPQAKGDWKLRGSTSVLFENDSPVFSVAIDRTYFAKRSTRLDFEDGALKDIVIEKESELAGFVQIPLQVAESVVSVPTSILQVRIDETNNRHRIIQAQHDLMLAHVAYLQSLEAYQNIADQSAVPLPDAGVYDEDRAMRREQRADLTGTAGRGPEQCLADCTKDPDAAPQCPAFCNCMAITCPASGDDAACEAFCAGLREN